MNRRRVGDEYTERPKRGRARRLWDALTSWSGKPPQALWYNPNCWGNSALGWGSWACRLHDGTELFCGERKAQIYVQKTSAPFTIVKIAP